MFCRCKFKSVLIWRWGGLNEHGSVATWEDSPKGGRTGAGGYGEVGSVTVETID